MTETEPVEYLPNSSPEEMEEKARKLALQAKIVRVSTWQFWLCAILLFLLVVPTLVSLSFSPHTIESAAYQAQSFIIALPLIPATMFAYLRMRSRTWSDPPRIQNPYLLLGLAVAALVVFAIPNVTEQIPTWLWTLLSTALLGVGAWAWIHFGRKGLAPVRHQRDWGIFSSGMILSPIIASLFQITFIVALVIVAGLVISKDPQFTAAFEDLGNKIMLSPTESMLSKTIVNTFATPPILFFGILFLSVFVPLIEEASKTIALWFLPRRDITPQYGFIGGLISGAGFAFFENMFIVSALGSGVEGILIRTTTTLMHMTTAGLVGWALTKTWKDKQYSRFVFSFISAVVIHGFWNGLVVFMVLPYLGEFLGTGVVLTELSPYITVGKYAPYLLGLLFAGVVTLFLRMNKMLRRDIIPPALPTEK